MIPTGYFDPIPQDDGGMNEFDYDERVKAGCFQSVIFFVFVIIGLLLATAGKESGHQCDNGNDAQQSAKAGGQIGVLHIVTSLSSNFTTTL